MPTNTVALALIALGGAVWWRGERITRAYLQARHTEKVRELALRERAQALEEQRAHGSEEMPEMPADLQFRIDAETEIWAREQVRSLVQQLWSKHKRWDPVRAELANLDAAALMQDMGWSQSSLLS